MINTYQVRLIHKQEIAERTLNFEFERPTGFEFQAGQYVLLMVKKQKGNSSLVLARAFSIASAPYEQTILLSMRMGESDFKNALRELKIGQEVQIQGPKGKFVLSFNKNEDIVFLVGGIGITPVRSILRQALSEGSSHHFFLFYSNRKPEDAAFFEELRDIKEQNYTFIPTMTDLSSSLTQWEGEHDFIDYEMIARYVPKPKESLYYIVGSTSFVQAMHAMLINQGILQRQIKEDDFGYVQ